MTCPKCPHPAKEGYSNSCSTLSWIAKERFGDLNFLDQDLAKRGWKNHRPDKAEYYRAWNCEACDIVIIDTSELIQRSELERAQ